MSIPKPKTVLHKRLFLNIWWQHLNIEDISIYIYIRTISFFAALVKGCRGFLFCVLCFCYSASVTSRLGHSELHTPSDRFFWTPFSKYSSQWLECGYWYCWRLYANVYYLYIHIYTWSGSWKIVGMTFCPQIGTAELISQNFQHSKHTLATIPKNNKEDKDERITCK